MYSIFAIFMQVKQRKIMRHKQTYDFWKMQIIYLENVINFS